MYLELEDRDAELLVTALRTRIEDLTWELARTDQHDLQHDLAQLVARLELLAARIDAQCSRSDLDAAVEP
ncbi:MAG TPA: hypothetical protein VN914_02120 [Polyangia bacterium]|nr:hypothetical protein [Polyangia bacterium]